jgi:hypothetical protein
MSGIINGPTTGASKGGLNNPLLAQAEEKLEANIVDPATHQNYMKIVVAGLNIALDKGPDGFMGKLRNSRDPVSDCATGAVALLLIMRKESKGVMPMKAGVPAGMTLMFHGLDFIDRARIAKIAEPDLDRATTIFTNTLFHKLGITPKMLQTAATNVHKITQDPGKMELINRKAGFVKSPDASQPTPLPGPNGLMNGGGAASGQPLPDA